MRRTVMAGAMCLVVSATEVAAAVPIWTGAFGQWSYLRTQS